MPEAEGKMNKDTRSASDTLLVRQSYVENGNCDTRAAFSRWALCRRKSLYLLQAEIDALDTLKVETLRKENTDR